jgi:hypothetical protein
MKTSFVGYTLLFFCFWFVISCSNISREVEKPQIEKAPFFGICSASEGPWGISDGIKVIRGDLEEFFCFEIESPPSMIRNKAEIHFFHRLDSLGETIYLHQVTHSIDSLYPFYALNSLNVFKVKEKWGAYFQTTLLGFPYGFEPTDYVMWVYYNEKVYVFKATLPTYPHSDWKETFSNSPDLNLKKDCIVAYKLISQKWIEIIEENEKHFNQELRKDL